MFCTSTRPNRYPGTQARTGLQGCCHFLHEVLCTASREARFIGIDGSKPTPDAAFGADPQAPHETIPYTEGGVRLLVTRLQRLQPTRWC